METRKRNFPQNQTIPEKLRIPLWNGLIRSTLTYAQQTQELTLAQTEKINIFSQKCMRYIIALIWYTRKTTTRHSHRNNESAQSIHPNGTADDNIMDSETKRHPKLQDKRDPQEKCTSRHSQERNKYKTNVGNMYSSYKDTMANTDGT